MKINSNIIGNYGPGYLNQVRQTTQTAQRSAQTDVVKAKQQIQQTQAKPEIQQAAAAKAENITNDEKNFFINLYPENKSEIVDYHFYQKTGKMSGVSVGSLFDRRG